MVWCGDRSGGQDFQQPLHFGHGVAREPLGIGQKNRRRVRAVLGLPQQVGGAHLAVDGLVGDHQGLGRPGEEIDAIVRETLRLPQAVAEKIGQMMQ